MYLSQPPVMPPRDPREGYVLNILNNWPLYALATIALIYLVKKI